MNMKLTIRNKDGSELGTCAVQADKSLLDIAADNDIIIPSSCKMWVCWVCLCNIIEWWSYILKKDVMPTEDDMCLACTAYVRPDAVDEDWTIIIQLIN